MLDSILKDRFLNLLFGTVVFFFVALVLIAASAHYQLHAWGILMVGYFLGLGGSDWSNWLRDKHKELNTLN
jgi:hypothetical protein